MDASLPRRRADGACRADATECRARQHLARPDFCAAGGTAARLGARPRYGPRVETDASVTLRINGGTAHPARPLDLARRDAAARRRALCRGVPDRPQAADGGWR